MPIHFILFWNPLPEGYGVCYAQPNPRERGLRKRGRHSSFRGYFTVPRMRKQLCLGEEVSYFALWIHLFLRFRPSTSGKPKSGRP